MKKTLKKFMNKNKEDYPWFKYYKDIPKRLKYFEYSIYDYFEISAKRNLSNVAIVYFGKKITYKTLLKEINNIASSLIENGIKQDDIVTICMANCPEAIVLFYAINKIGAISNIVHPLSAENEIYECILNTESKLVFINDIVFTKIKNIERNLRLKKVIVVPLSNKMDTLHKIGYNLTKSVNMKDMPNNFQYYNNFINIGSKEIPSAKRKYSSDAVILYSGGSTGKPKGVVLSNLCFNSIPKQYSYIIDAKPKDSILSYLPIFHGFGLCVSIHTPLTYGMKCILDPKIDVKKINKIIKKHKINFLPVIPSLLNVLISDKFVGKKDLSSLKYVVSGGDFLSYDLKVNSEKFLIDHGSNAKIIVGYGLTEVTAAVVASIEENYRSKSVGVPLSDNKYKVVRNDTHDVCDKYEIGEICLSGPSLMSRYYKNENETFKTLQIHEDGKVWLHTGDLGYVGSDDILYFETRKKRMIISNGFNIYPGYIEEVLNKHEYIQSSIVVGKKDKVKTQIVKAVIVLKEGITNTFEVKKEIKDYLKQNLSKYAIPEIIEYRSELPKTKVGKVDFRALEK